MVVYIKQKMLSFFSVENENLSFSVETMFMVSDCVPCSEQLGFDAGGVEAEWRGEIKQNRMKISTMLMFEVS